MDLAIVRYPRTGSDKAVYSALKQACKMSGGNCNPLMAACAFALYVVIWLILGVGIASEVLEQKFDGVVAPRQWVQVVPKVDGVISRILFTPGQRVSKGDVLFEIDPDDFAIDVRIAQAELDETRAHLSMAEDAAARQAVLLKQNSTANQVARQSDIDVEIARARCP
jgi:multidrug efflux pump subunit AcrA (membrane-fusion protein)